MKPLRAVRQAAPDLFQQKIILVRASESTKIYLSFAGMGRRGVNAEASIKDAVNDAFSDPSSQYVTEYLDTLRANLRDVAAAVGQQLIFLLLAVGLFELLARAAIEKVSVSGFEVKDLSIINRLLPVVIAYFLYDIIYFTQLRNALLDAHNEIIRLRYGHIDKGPLVELLEPRRPSLLAPNFIKPRNDRLLEGFSSAILFVVIFGVVVFEIYASYLLLDQFGPSDLLVLGTIILTSAFLFFAFYIPVRAALPSRAGRGRP